MKTADRKYTAEQFNDILAIVREAQTVDTKANAVSGKLMKVACTFGTDFEAFGAAIDDVATHWKKRSHKTALPRTFTQCKSNIVAAMKLGIEPSAHSTESSLRSALNAKRKALKADEQPTPQQSIVAQAKAVVTSSTGSKAVTQLLHILSTVAAEDADKLASALLQQAETYASNVRKDADEAAKAARAKLKTTAK